MNISEVPENHWMLVDQNREVLFHSENCGDVVRESRKYPFGEVFMEKKFTGLLCLGLEEEK